MLKFLTHKLRNQTLNEIRPLSQTMISSESPRPCCDARDVERVIFAAQRPVTEVPRCCGSSTDCHTVVGGPATGSQDSESCPVVRGAAMTVADDDGASMTVADGLPAGWAQENGSAGQLHRGRTDGRERNDVSDGAQCLQPTPERSPLTAAAHVRETGAQAKRKRQAELKVALLTGPYGPSDSSDDEVQELLAACGARPLAGASTLRSEESSVKAPACQRRSEELTSSAQRATDGVRAADSEAPASAVAAVTEVSDAVNSPRKRLCVQTVMPAEQSPGCHGVGGTRPSLDLEKMHQKAAALRRHYPKTVRIRCWNSGGNLINMKTILHDPEHFLFRSIDTRFPASSMTPVERPAACSF